MMMKFKLPKITFNRNPADRTFVEKIARRFILPPHGPASLGITQWGVRDDRLKAKYPWRYWAWDTVPMWWDRNFTQRKKAVRNWLRFRTWDRYDILRLEISKDYHDPDYILFNANFQVLKDFVEIELAAMSEVSSEDDPDGDDVTGFLKSFGKKFRRNRRKKIRCGDLGLKHLEWEIAETSGTQNTSAKEKKDLYLWWTQVRPARVDIYDTALLNDDRDFDDDSFKAIFNRPFNQNLHQARRKLEAFYEEEDEEMLIRLVKIRRSLWT